MPIVSGVKVTFWKAAARANDLVYMAVTQDDLVEKEASHSIYLGLDRGEWRSGGDEKWSTIAICAAKKPAEKLLAISEDGDVYTYVGGKKTSETIGGVKGSLTALNVIDGFVVACGMKRQVFLRSNENKWEDISAPESKGDTATGFEAIAGFSLQDLYAVGWSGEIWQRAKGKWKQRKSPVDLILTGVTCDDEGSVYICGQNGTVLMGREDEWTQVAGAKEDLWDIHAFNGKVYVASFTTLYEVTNAKLKPVKLPWKEDLTFHRLTSADGVIWSVGAENLLSFDGKKWEKFV